MLSDVESLLKRKVEASWLELGVAACGSLGFTVLVVTTAVVAVRNTVGMAPFVSSKWMHRQCDRE